MSFILDALKKSETERQQSSSTEFAAVPSNPARPSFPRWLLVLGVLLAVNLAVLIGLLLRTDSPAEMPAATPLPGNAVETPPTAASFQDQVAAARKNPPARSEVDMPRETVAVSAPEDLPKKSPDLQAVLISQDPSSVPPNQLYPTIQEIRVNGNIDIPDLHLDIHVFSETPADRFVFINMTKLREGSRLEEGPAVVEITPDGVVLRHLGKSFLIPRD